MMLNLLQIMFFILSFLTLILGISVNWFSYYLPSIIINTYRYGKFSYQGAVPFSIQVPKRWFRHFYVFSSIWSLFTFYLMCSTYLGTGMRIPHFFSNLLKLLGTKTNTVPASASLLAMALLMLQCFKRFYETHFVSVFSNAKMDVSHYICGLAHYFGAVLAILCEAPGILYPEEKYTFSAQDLGIRHFIFAISFIWASKNQLLSAKILGDLRKNKEGKIITTKYNVPYGGYFEVVSCPHQFFEVVMYLSLWMILLGNETWPFVVLWVIINQVETSLLSHWWYKDTFKEYPSQRKAILPFIL